MPCAWTSLTHGMVPLIAEAGEPTDVLKSYIGLYLREEVQMESLVRNIGSFSRFLEAISFSPSGVLNLTNVARECQVERKTVEGYVTILEDLLLAFRLPVFNRRAKREMTVHSKFYLSDCGVFRSLRPSGPLERAEEMAGPALEGLVAQHLRAWNSYRGETNQLYHWRTRAGNEVDLICYGEDGLFAIEVKNGAVLHPEDFRGLTAFGEDYPESRRILLYGGQERLRRNDILCMPVADFLLKLHPRQSFPGA